MQKKEQSVTKHIEKVKNPVIRPIKEYSPKEKKAQIRRWLTNPKSRKIIYGVTDRTDDPLILKINDFFIDYGKVGLKEKALFFNSLRLLVNSGVGFTQALKMLGDRTRNIRLSRICNTMVYDMDRNGRSFSEAMGKYPNIFAKAEIKMIYSGELTGKIESTLDSVATQLQKSINLELKIKNALIYPITVFIAIILAAFVVMVFIVPKFMDLFSQFGSDLPWATKVLVGTSNFFQHFWWAVAVLMVMGWMTFQSWKKTPDGQRSWDGYLLKMPLIKELVNNIQTVRIANNFATLMLAGIPLNKALRVLGDIIPNAVVSDAIFAIEMKIRKGKALHEAFAQESAIDPVVAEILEVGERTGHIDDVLKKLGTQYEMEVESQLKNLTTMIEPIIIIVVGLAVVFIAMAIMLPIFQLQELFTNAS